MYLGLHQQNHGDSHGHSLTPRSPEPRKLFHGIYRWDSNGIYPLEFHIAIENGDYDVDLPSYKMVIFHSYVNVYQRVHDFTCKHGTIQ